MIVGEFEPVLLLDPRELRIGQAGPDPHAAETGQIRSGPLPEFDRVVAEHLDTVASALR